MIAFYGMQFSIPTTICPTYYFHFNEILLLIIYYFNALIRLFTTYFPLSRRQNVAELRFNLKTELSNIRQQHWQYNKKIILIKMR